MAGSGLMTRFPDEDPDRSGDATPDAYAALWHLRDEVYGIGATGLDGLVTGDLVDHAAPIEPQFREAGHLGALLTVADLPPNFRAA